MDRSQCDYKRRKKKSGEWGDHRGDRTAQSGRYAKKYPERIRANRLLQYAVQTGKIRKPKWCQDCRHRPVAGGHHEDHEKPYEVDWLCWWCHNKLRIRLRKVA